MQASRTGVPIIINRSANGFRCFAEALSELNAAHLDHARWRTCQPNGTYEHGLCKGLPCVPFNAQHPNLHIYQLPPSLPVLSVRQDISLKGTALQRGYGLIRLP